MAQETGKKSHVTANPRKYTIVHMVTVGYSRVRLPKITRCKVKDLSAYIDKHDLDPAFIFEGWPGLQGEKSEKQIGCATASVSDCQASE